MGWRFSKRIRVIPGIRINLSTKGISTTIGTRGANVTLSSRGNYVNLGIPGTGISYRQRIGGPDIHPQKPRVPGLPRPRVDAILVDDIVTADIEEVTTQDMQGIKQTIQWAHAQRAELKNDIANVSKTLDSTKFKLQISKLFLLPLWHKAFVEQLKVDIDYQGATINVLRQSIESSLIDLTIEFDDILKEKFLDVVDMYRILSYSEKVWDITASYFQDSVVTRSSASTLIARSEVKINRQNLIELKCNYVAMHFENANGADIYIYPDFIILYNSIYEFAIIGFHELAIQLESTRFLEEGKVPSDSTIIGYTWAKVNKDGSPDRRFRDNYQIPIVQYADISFQTNSGLHEAYQFSKYEAACEFFLAIKAYQLTINTLKRN